MKTKQPKNFHIITIFPESMESYLGVSILKRAIDNKLIKINFINPRDFSSDKRGTVDDSPYGGGPGMVMKVEPIYKALSKIKSKINLSGKETRTILFSTRGKKFLQKDAIRLNKYKNIILICGRYEGVDERIGKIADEELSIGDYILSGGELPALVVIEAISRQIDGVLGKTESLEEIKGSYPVFTRPEIFITKEGKKMKVPKVLLSGDHKKIEEWRKSNK